MKLLTVVGARPQFVKAGVVSKAFAAHPSIDEIVVHTGQHYDPNMSDIFFTELQMPRPDYQLNINGSSHGAMTGRMLMEIERIIQDSNPDRVLVYGDTNSTLAGALAAAKLHVPVVHVEAGLRSFNMKMPEEINRVLTDRISDILFCPTETAISNLRNEGISDGNVRVNHCGDVMEDSAKMFAPFSTVPANLEGYENFVLATLHRAENTDDPVRLAGIIAGLNSIHETIAPVILPLHPRTHAVIQKLGIKLNVQTIEPVGYLDMLGLLKRCSLVITDSGGLQKEAFFFHKACVTVRDQTEWVELIEAGANQLCAPQAEQIIALAQENIGRTISDDGELYGGGKASARIAECLAGLED
ncbi:UDP-N-acetylglucosamine 2-epimerase (non-hydrolyzing) [Alcaligenaceae bacterium]|nr:UDP-N-acetylglucosamine 2-epimerase (non-hydrolyzing) [Alcaligenaceae bacterium]